MPEAYEHNDGLVLAKFRQCPPQDAITSGILGPVERNGAKPLGMQAQHEVHCEQSAVDPPLMSFSGTPVTPQRNRDQRDSRYVVPKPPGSALDLQ